MSPPARRLPGGLPRRGHVAVLLLLVVSAGCLSGVPGVGPADPTRTDGPAGTDDGVEVTVIDVVDGDTIDIAYDNGTQDTVRLLGVDSPEVRSSNDPAEYTGVPTTQAGERCLRRAGADASAYAVDRLAGESVTLVFDPQSEQRGYYGRLLAYVFVDGESFNHALLREGHARVYDTTFTERERYERTAEAARADRRGLWSCVDADGGNADGTVGETALEVIEINYDAPGNDNDNLDEESVTFRNDGSDPLDVSGWTVADDGGHSYTFPDGTVVDPGAEVTLRTGSGTDTARTYYWGRSGAVWNNDGDVVTVRNATGSTVIRLPY
ncbi:lamin tail domain-containing protein [Halobellus ruber]|uniref:lamin tail domain-containing protein n=1 Tax=Halobellus ruber TaxID=2761102 RepID=UPI0031B5666C